MPLLALICLCRDAYRLFKDKGHPTRMRPHTHPSRKSSPSPQILTWDPQIRSKSTGLTIRNPLLTMIFSSVALSIAWPPQMQSVESISSINHQKSPGLDPASPHNQRLVCSHLGCGATFSGESRFGNYRRHFKTLHQTHSRYKCSLSSCSKSYQRSDAKRKHERLKHPGLPGPPKRIRYSASIRRSPEESGHNQARLFQSPPVAGHSMSIANLVPHVKEVRCTAIYSRIVSFD